MILLSLIYLRLYKKWETLNNKRNCFYEKCALTSYEKINWRNPFKYKKINKLNDET